MIRWLLIIVILLPLTGCAIRESKASKATQPNPETKIFAIDRSNVFLAEATVPLQTLDKTLDTVGKNHAYHEWNDEFIQETVTEVTSLKTGEAIESSMYSESNRGQDEVAIKLIRADDNKIIVRLTTSNPDLAKELQSDFE